MAKLPGIGEAYAAKIVGGGPYKTFDEIVKRNIMPAAAFNKVRQHVFIQ